MKRAAVFVAAELIGIGVVGVIALAVLTLADGRYETSW